MIIPLLVKKLDPRAIIPTRAHGGDLGYDLYALEDTWLRLGHVQRVRTGVVVYLAGYGFKVEARSSMGMKGIIVTGGVIDCGYRGELYVSLALVAPPNSGTLDYMVNAGDKIAQMIPVTAIPQSDTWEVEELPPGDRDANGYGSSGR